MSSGTVSLLELVDLSLGTPEIVNYKGLRALLIAIVESLNIGDVRADLKESDRAELLAASAAAAAATAERPVSSDSAGSMDKSRSDLIRIHSAESSPAPKEVQDLEQKVSKLEAQIEALNSLPSNEDLMQRARSMEGMKPMSEMWQLMQLQKKASANEDGVSKLMSMVEDLLGEMAALRKHVDGFGSEINNLKDRLNKISENEDSINEKLLKLENSTANKDRMDELQRIMNDLNNRMNTLPPLDILVTWPAMEDALKGIYKEPTTVYDHAMQTVTSTETSQVQTMPTTSSYSQTRTPSPGPPSRPGSASHPSAEIQRILRDIGELKGRHDSMEDRVKTLEDLMNGKADMDDVKRLLGDKQDVPEDLSKMLAELREGLESLNEGREKDGEMITNMQKLILQLQAEVDKLNNTCIHLVDEHNSKQKHIDALYTFVDRLQENKADKEHVIMEIDVKADKRALENKVSTTQFQGTVDELSKNLNDVLDKLTGHRSAWQDAVSEMKLDIDNKLDRMELDPLKTYLDKRIKSVGAKLVRKTETESTVDDAAGFRKPLLHKFNCISCDRPLDMTPQPPLASLPESKGLPGMRTGRPYTTFELEQIRAAQKKTVNPAAPNVEIFRIETAPLPAPSGPQGELMRLKHSRLISDTLSKQKVSLLSGNVEGSDYFSTNRSCGGSHTMTYPHRRTTRITNVTNIVREDDLPPNFVNGKIEADIQGQDGHIYKGRIGPTDLERLPTIAPQKPPSARSPRPASSRGYRQDNQLSKSSPDRHTPRPKSARPHSLSPTSQSQSERSHRSLPMTRAESRPSTPTDAMPDVPAGQDSNSNVIKESHEQPVEVQ